jgi:hypothetical protein
VDKDIWTTENDIAAAVQYASLYLSLIMLYFLCWIRHAPFFFMKILITQVHNKWEHKEGPRTKQQNRKQLKYTEVE